MFAPTEYQYSMPIRGDGRGALDLAETTLMAQVFEILDTSPSELRARGPGMHNTQQPALLGATEIHLQLAGSTITATALLGGVARM